MERQQYERVIFDNVADQYVKGEDVIAYFTVLFSQQIDPNEDQIGLIRVGCTDIRKCLAYTSVKFNPSTTFGSNRSGTGRFSSLLLPVADDEFYQFCYIHKRTTSLGSSIPFQLNCTSDDVDYLFNSFSEKPNELIAFDHDDDVVIITQTNTAPTEGKSRRSSSHLQHPIQKSTIDRSPSASMNVSNESDQLRSQLAMTIQFTKDQATQIVQLERHLMQANESAKKSQQRQIVLEQQLRDFQLTSEKRQRSLEGQLKYSTNQQQLQLEQQLRDLTLTSEKYQRSMQGQLKQSFNQQLQLEQQLRDSKLTAEKYQRSTQGQFTTHSKQVAYQEQTQNPSQSNEQAFRALKSSFNAIEKRCVKHQQNEIDLKRQLMIYQKFVGDLQHEIEHLNTRLSTSTDEYNELFSKYSTMEYRMNGNHFDE